MRFFPLVRAESNDQKWFYLVIEINEPSVIRSSTLEVEILIIQPEIKQFAQIIMLIKHTLDHFTQVIILIE